MKQREHSPVICCRRGGGGGAAVRSAAVFVEVLLRPWDPLQMINTDIKLTYIYDNDSDECVIGQLLASSTLINYE